MASSRSSWRSAAAATRASIWRSACRIEQERFGIKRARPRWVGPFSYGLLRRRTASPLCQERPRLRDLAPDRIGAFSEFYGLLIMLPCLGGVAHRQCGTGGAERGGKTARLLLQHGSERRQRLPRHPVVQQHHGVLLARRDEGTWCHGRLL